MTKPQRHTHKYYKALDELWYCGLPNCTHFLPHNVSHTIDGRESICWNCGDKFSLNAAAIKEDKPRCDSCRVDSAGLDDFLKEQGL